MEGERHTSQGTTRSTDARSATGPVRVQHASNDETSSGSQAGAPSTFRCFACGRTFRWVPEIAGKSLRCKCGEKVRCPEPRDETFTAAQSLDDTLDDTVAEVVIQEHLDTLDRTGQESAASDQANDSEGVRIIPQKGVFGWTIGRDVLFWMCWSLVGLACAILAAIVQERFVAYIVAAVIIGPYSWWRLYKSWPRWTQGRPWLQCLTEDLGG